MISSISYKTNAVKQLCILNHTSSCLKCASTQMKTVHLQGQDKIIKADIVEHICQNSVKGISTT